MHWKWNWLPLYEIITDPTDLGSASQNYKKSSRKQWQENQQMEELPLNRIHFWDWRHCLWKGKILILANHFKSRVSHYLAVCCIAFLKPEITASFQKSDFLASKQSPQSKGDSELPCLVLWLIWCSRLPIKEYWRQYHCYINFGRIWSKH